ncbi:acyl-CoA dehydrogenase family protein [Sphingopyxis sp. R3-92]|uniref:acyl-CoA dehydrogenase family protein n=1 Tax=Sphingopyxis sp. R3-92 TaxID=3158553 RepID=UPI003EE5CC65
MTQANSKGLDSPAIPTAEELIARARALIPTLNQRARQTTLDGDISAATMEDLRAAGFFRILQPRRYGGYEMEPGIFYEVQKLLAEGCMSTGWVYGVLGCHPYQLALFADEAQREVWGDNADMLVSSTYQPVGKVEKADGGFYLSGRWGFSSGSSHCGWVLLGSLYFPEDGTPDLRTFLLPASDYQVIKGTWDVFGLQGTGSFDIVVDRAFVPEHRTHRSSDGFACTNPGQQVNDAPLYRLPWAQVFVRAVSTAAFGSARAAIRAGLEIANNRISTNTGKASKSDPILQSALARAIAEVDEMELRQQASFDTMMDYAERGVAIPIERRTLFAYQSSTVVRRMADLVDNIVKLLGGRAIYMSSPILQPWLDLKAARAHVANDPGIRAADVLGTMAGEQPAFNYI